MKSLQHMNRMDRQFDAFKKARSSGHRAANDMPAIDGVPLGNGNRLSIVAGKEIASARVKKTQDALEFILCGEFSENFYSFSWPAVMGRVITAWDSSVLASETQQLLAKL